MEDNKKEILKIFLNELVKEKITLIDVLKEVIKKDWKNQKTYFDFGIVYNKKLLYLEESEAEIELETNDETAVGNAFYIKYGLDEKYRGFCKHIGTWVLKDNKDTVDIYYFGAFQMYSKIDLLYVNALEDIYCEWLSKEIARILREKSGHGEPRLPQGLSGKKAFLIGKAAEHFKELVMQFFDIDLNVINEISGTYYEGAECGARMCFVFGDSLPTKNLRIKFSNPFVVSIENIRGIRKRLQLVKSGQSLVALKSNAGQWEIVGLLDGKQEKSIIFSMTRHMTWEMKIGEGLVTCYKCGKYLIEHPKFVLEKFESKFREIFSESGPSAEHIKKLVEAAMEQTHGTTLTILENKKAKSEAELLAKCSTGIGIEDKLLQEEDVASISSIDGAMLISETGWCFGIGMIFDSKVSLEGDTSRGARYNSAQKYIKYCRDELKAGAIAVVVSEDKTVDVISTKDKFKGDPEVEE